MSTLFTAAVYRGRVRSGCLTCRARKVKCDEAKPVCAKCARLDRQCIYKSRKGQTRAGPAGQARQSSLTLSTAGTEEEEEDEGGTTQVPLAPNHESLWVPTTAIAATFPSPVASSASTTSGGEGSISTGGTTCDPIATLASPSTAHVTAQLEKALWRSHHSHHDGRHRFEPPGSDSPHGGGGETESPSALISRDIELTTTMDLIAARGVADNPAFPGLSIRPPSTDFFLREVDCPGITPFDPVNWAVAKRHAVGLAENGSQVVAEAIAAVCAVYRAQLYGVAVPGAKMLYESARQMLRHMSLPLTIHSGDAPLSGAHCCDEVLLVSFLLCLAELVHNEGPYKTEDGPVLKGCDVVASRLEDWLAGFRRRVTTGSMLSPLSTRLVAWLRIIHRITLRGGGSGLISDRVYTTLCRLHGEDHPTSPLHDINMNDDDSLVITSHQPILSSQHHCYSSHAYLPNLEADSGISSEDMLYQALAGPLFEFYYRLQLLSGHVARLTHYHRSRLTAGDQDAVVSRIATIRAALHSLRETRGISNSSSGSSSRSSDDSTMTCGGLDAAALRSQLAPDVAGRLVLLMRLCEAAYHAEIVELDRVLGDPVQRYSRESRASVRAIMHLIDQDREGSAKTTAAVAAVAARLSAGFLRPLFLCAIETIDDAEQTAWAVQGMAEMGDPVYRSGFFAAFGEALAEAQRRKERRVTSRYFCLSFFGVSPPFM
ncbi:RNA polymerase II-specific transcription factor-like protein [Microdochium nivale]|nr:RNA polymerase II-specific transcription factor-like protein [Microdochium nivale]